MHLRLSVALLFFAAMVDAALWQQALADVKPLRAAERLSPQPAPITGARQFAEDEARVMPEAMEQFIEPDELEAGDETEFRADGVSRSQIRKLRRGQYAIQEVNSNA